jgi:CBS domain-containing protein
MLAKEIMTTNIITVTSDASAQDIARMLLEHRISAVPVLNAQGEVVGMVSEGDLTGRNEIRRLERRDWWLSMLAEGEQLAPEFVSNIQTQARKAHEIMSSPVVVVSEDTEASEIAQLLTERNIKRVPVVKDKRIVGLVSRADLLRAFASPAKV